MFYDGLNRLIGTVNPSGGLTFTSYDALNNAIGRQAGGWHAPRLIDNVINRVQVSSEGATLEWRTDHATDGVVQVRRAGSTDEWQSFGLEGDYGLDHSLEIAGLAADTLYEYRLAISDAFGYRLTTSTHTFRTAQATQGVTVSGLQAADSGYQSDIAFALPPGARDVSVIVGGLSGDRLNLADATSFTPIREADGSYRATVRFADAQAALYQIRWTDGAGVAHVTAPEAIQQQQALHRFDGQVTATPTNDSGIYDVTVYWSLPLDQVGSYTETEVDPDTGESRDVRGYTAYVGYQRLDEFGEGDEPEYEELSLGPDGRLSFTFERMLEGPYSLHFFYVDPDDAIVRGPAIEVENLANADRQYQRLYLQFPDLSADAPVEQSSFFYRPQGSVDDWLELPASAVHGLAIDVLGLPEGDYEFRAPVRVDGEERISYGNFRLREPASVERLLQSPTVTGLVDLQQPGSAVTYSVDGGLLRFPELFPLNYGERVQFIATDRATGQARQLSMVLGYANLSELLAGDYSFQLIKTRTETITHTEIDPETGEETAVTETIERLLNDINGNVRTYPALTYQLDDNRLTLEGLWPLNEGERLDAVARDADGSEHVLVFGDDGQLDLTALPPGSFDLVIRKLATGQAGGILAEFSGHVVVAPLQLLDAEISAMAGVRSPRAYWQTAEAQPQEVAVELLAGDSTVSADNVHTLYDANGRKLYSNEDGGVWTRYDYDAQGNVVREARFKLYDASSGTFLEQIQNRAERPALAELEHSFAKAQEAHQRGEDTLRIISRAYDAAGNTIRETAHSRAYGELTNEPGELTSEWQYDRYGNKTAETIAKGVAGEELRTTYTYDAYDRLTSVTFGPFQYFQPNAAGELTPEHGSVSQTFTYDKAGNRSTATNERGYRERFHYDAANRLVSQWDAQGEVSGGWGKSGLRTDYQYDHFGRLVLRRETDLTKPAGTADSVRTLEARYDVFDQQVWMKDALGLITTRRYDLDGNVLAETDANGHALVMAASELPEEVAEWARQTRERLGFPADAAELSEAQKAQLLAKYTEHYRYDGENQMIRRTDRLGNVWSTAYDAYGNIVSERDGNGRVTTYKIGAFGQVLSKEVKLPTVQVRSVPLPAIRKLPFGGGAIPYDQGSKLYTTSAGVQQYTEETAYDWLGRSIRITDSFGRDDEFVYDDADRLHRLTKRMVDGSQTSEYGYDLRGNRTSETLTLNGEEIRRQTLDYNERGWLIEVSTEFDLHNRSVAGETLTLQHSYDAAGNRVAQRTLHGRDDGSSRDTTHVYRFDGANRMLSAFDPKAGEQGELIDSIGYDGFGNRIQIARNGTVIDYHYDLGGRVQRAQVQGSDTSETWDYDALGNSILHRQADGAYTQSVYDTAGRAMETKSYAKGDDNKWQTTTSRLVYDRAGNLAVTTVSADNYRFDEVTKVDVRYETQTKSLHNSWVKKARGMTGTTRFSYDVNGQLVTLNRGSSKKNKPDTVAYFRYDNDGHILSRTDQASAVSRAEYLYGYDDPQARTTQIARHAFRLGISEADAAAHMQQAELYAIENGGMWNVHGFAGGAHQANSPIELQSYVYINGQPVADLAATRALQFKTLVVRDADRRLLGHDTYYDPEWGMPYQVPRYGGVLLTAEDIVHAADGSIDREATARQLATRLYAQPQSLAAALDDLDADSWYGNRGSQSARFSDLSTATQARLVAHLAGLLPADDGAIAAGTELILSVYLDLVDTSDSDVRLTSDYAYQAIGGTDGLPGGSVSRHVVREGDTLASLAQAYFGSSHYWYLLADANHLSGDEPLTAGRSLTIPNVVANSVNAHDSHALYRESEIIGATSPEAKVQQKKKKWYQKLVQVVIVIAIVVVAIWIATVAGPLVGQIAGQVAGSALGAALGTTLGTAVGYAVGFAAVAAMGFATGFATSYLTQTLAIAADLQEGYDWKGMRKMGTSFALTAVASGIGSWAESLSAGKEALVQGATQAGVQLIENDGKITNVSGILMAMAPGAAGLAKAGEWGKTAEVLEKASKHKGMVGAGLSVLEASIRDNENTLHWVHFAAAAIGGTIGGRDLIDTRGGIEWGTVAREAVIATTLSLVVGDRFGEDAALDFFGNYIGEVIGSGMKEWGEEAAARQYLAELSDTDHQAYAVLRADGLTSKEALERLKKIAVDGLPAGYHHGVVTKEALSPEAALAALAAHKPLHDPKIREEYMTREIDGVGDGELLEALQVVVQENPDEDALKAALGKVADVYNLSEEAAYAQYGEFKARQKEAQDRVTNNKKDPIAPLDPKLSKYMLSDTQLRYGAIVGDALGLNPAFGALLNPTGGIVGKGNSNFLLREVLPRIPWLGSAISYHGIIHDAGGYLHNYHSDPQGKPIGSGYDYLRAPYEFKPSHHLSGQLSGLLNWMFQAPSVFVSKQLGGRN
ncbi:MAG TPA: LysM peptidoglycan-binding domain-containing protein [Gammaproteobacteria bacterium]|nr:LysM peptidoglycan-binding domain-containing protein [Gammaproteobacteria bacterium]